MDEEIEDETSSDGSVIQRAMNLSIDEKFLRRIRLTFLNDYISGAHDDGRADRERDECR